MSDLLKRIDAALEEYPYQSYQPYGLLQDTFNEIVHLHSEITELNSDLTAAKADTGCWKIVVDGQAKTIDELNDVVYEQKVELDKVQARIAQLEDAALNAISFMPGGQAKADLRDAYDGEVPATAWLLIKQAEAVEPAIRTALRNLGNVGLCEDDIKRFAHVYAQLMRDQADKLEQSE